MSPPPGSVRWTLSALYARFHCRVVARARTLLGDIEAARDVAHDVFVRIALDQAHVLGLAEPMTWMYRVTTNLCLNRLRDGRRRYKLLAGRPANDSYAGNAEARVILSDLLRAVPAELQDVAAYYHVDGMTQQEIARLIGVPRRTVGYHLMSFYVTASGRSR